MQALETIITSWPLAAVIVTSIVMLTVRRLHADR
jgi:hypothetical protein